MNFSPKLEEAIHIAKSIAKEHSHKEYSASHLLKALLHKNIGMMAYIESIGQDAYYIEEWAEVRLESFPKTVKVINDIKPNDSAEAVFTEADNILHKINSDQVNEICVLVALCTPGVGFSYEQLKTFPLTPAEIISNISQNSNQEIQGVIKTNASQIKSNEASKILDSYCINKSLKATNNELEVIFGRDIEIKTITEILGRRSKPNVLLLGDSGVGKTVMLNALTYATLDSAMPSHLKNAQVYELDFISLTSGAGYKGEVEDRLKKVIDTLKNFEKPILLIDELNNLTNKNSSNEGLINILKAELVKGEITIIATATNDSFRKHIEIDESLSRQFELIKLQEPNENEAFRMIKNTISYYTNYHNLTIDDESIKEAIRLAKRYNKERSLPDSAIDLIDRTMSATKFMIETSSTQIENLQEEINQLEQQQLSEEDFLTEQSWLSLQMKNKLSYLLFGELKEDELYSNVKEAEEGFKILKNLVNSLSELASVEKKYVTKNDIALTIANKTGIPIGKLQSDEKERLLSMDDILRKRVIGQDHAISVITDAILESRSGLSKPNLPIGSFFFSGPTGTGKTELAKSLAEFLFQTETSIIRFDMSEFKEEHSAALLYGAPPGYVGYEEGGLLVNKIRQNPYSIVLFDEIEKAHPSVFDIFLQILDEGKLHDRLGKEGDFSNAVILFTSNIGSSYIVDTFGQGIIPKSSDLLEMMGNHFRPEFLGRLTEIIPFSPITEENITKIFNIQLKDLYKALHKQGISLEISDNAIDVLAKKGFTPKYGARPLRTVIRNDLRSPLSKKIISGDIKKGSKISLDVNKENDLIWEY
ncbi:ATP-dependent Clp protease ATP-binding subunit [Tenacibaculum sp.]|nr:ATP-dependent Clp protease ATP-binding subunit [Tenacibaculum sp.]